MLSFKLFTVNYRSVEDEVVFLGTDPPNQLSPFDQILSDPPAIQSSSDPLTVSSDPPTVAQLSSNPQVQPSSNLLAIARPSSDQLATSPLFQGSSDEPYEPCDQACDQLSSNGCQSSSTALDTLLLLFAEKFTVKQIKAVHCSTAYDLDESVECLASGASLEAISKMLTNRYRQYPLEKVHIDADEIWSDLLSYYKCVTTCKLTKKCIRIRLQGEPAVDTGGVRRQIYTTVFSEFMDNTHMHLFDGPPNSLRPHYSAESRGSGIFKALGMMVGHSICQDGVGFPYLSPLCYWYICRGENEALQFASLDDVGEDVRAFVTQVYYVCILHYVFILYYSYSVLRVLMIFLNCSMMSQCMKYFSEQISE